MKKIAMAVLLSFVAAALFAYNPPVYGDSYLELSSAKNLSGGTSVAGGAIFSGVPDTIVVNPALAAQEQRIVLNAGYTGLFSSNKNNAAGYGNAFQISGLIPFKIFILSAYVNGTMVPFEEMNLRNSFTFKTAVSKPITENFDLGIGITSAVCWGSGTDWDLGADLGGIYRLGDLAFMKDFRIGASLLNLGKTFNGLTNIGIDGTADSGYPLPITLKAGAAASLYRNDIIDVAASADFTFPAFQNLIADATVQLMVKQMLCITVSEKINLRELSNNCASLIPSIGLNFKFAFDFKDNDYMADKGWAQSEMNAYAAYRNINKTVTAASLGVDVLLGMKDTTPPVIELWIDEDDE